MREAIQVIADGFVAVVENFRQLAKALAIPVFAMLAVVHPWFPRSLDWVATIVNLAATVLIAVTTHRILLGGRHSVPEWGINRFGSREIKFLLCEFALAMCFAPLAFVSHPMGMMVVFLLCAYVVCRISLVLPSVATDSGLSFVDSSRRITN